MENFLSPLKVLEAYSEAGVKKFGKKFLPCFLLAVLAGALIALAAAASSTAAHTASSVGAGRLISGMLFPFGLSIVILSAAELFTGNSLIVISLLDKKVSFRSMLRNWLIVYSGNFLGSVLIAALCAYCGQLNYSEGALALYTMKLAEAKASMPFFNGFFSGIACNVLVCLGVFCSMTARDTSGKILGAFLPVALFVLCGFEHCVANMYYIPAGLFAKSLPEYASLAESSGLMLQNLSWLNFLKSLVPVTFGNIAGGSGIAAFLWLYHKRAAMPEPPAMFPRVTGTRLFKKFSQLRFCSIKPELSAREAYSGRLLAKSPAGI